MAIIPCEPCASCTDGNIPNDKFKQDVITILCQTLDALGYVFPGEDCDPCACIQANIPNDKFKQDVEILLCLILANIGGGGGGGSVTSFSFTDANGISGVVTNPNTTPNLTLDLGDITPDSVAAVGTVTGSNLSGTNTGDQTITLTGDVTGSGTGIFAATIANDAVTFAKFQNITTARLLGRATAGSGDMEEITLGTGLSFTGTTLNSSGAASAITVGTTTATSGTVGSVLFVGTGPVVDQDNANFFWDNTNNRLGLGTNAPGKILDIFTTGRCRVEAGVGAGFWYNATTTDKWFVGTDGTASQYFRFHMGANALKLGPTNTLNPMHEFFQELAITNAVQVFLNNAITVNQSATGGYTGIKTTITETATGSGVKKALDLEIGGTSRFSVNRGRVNYRYNALSADTTLDDTHSIVTVDASGATRTITLPAASTCTGGTYTIKKIDSSTNPVVVEANAAETIDGALNQTLSTQYACMSIVSDGSNWWIIPTYQGAKFLFAYFPQNNEPPAANFATIDSRNSRPVLNFDDTTQEAGVCTVIIPTWYQGGNVVVAVEWAAASAVTGTIGWDWTFEKTIPGTTDIDGDDWATAQTITATTVSGTSGITLLTSVTITAGATGTDSLTALSQVRGRLRRDVANDSAAGDAQMVAVYCYEV